MGELHNVETRVLFIFLAWPCSWSPGREEGSERSDISRGCHGSLVNSCEAASERLVPKEVTCHRVTYKGPFDLCQCTDSNSSWNDMLKWHFVWIQICAVAVAVALWTKRHWLCFSLSSLNVCDVCVNHLWSAYLGFYLAVKGRRTSHSTRESITTAERFL